MRTRAQAECCLGMFPGHSLKCGLSLLLIFMLLPADTVGSNLPGNGRQKDSLNVPIIDISLLNLVNDDLSCYFLLV